MTLFDFLAAPSVQAFSIAGVVVLLLLLLEVLGLLLSASPGAALDDWLDLDKGGPDKGAIEGTGPLATGLAWLNFGRLPALAVLVLLFGGFAAVGLGLQGLALQVGGGLVSAWLLAVPALIGAGFAAHSLGGLFARVVPREESYAVTQDQLVGRIARLTIGPADGETPGRALVTDGAGNSHNVRVLSGVAGRRFEAGERVLLATRQDGLFLITAVPDSMAPVETTR